MAAAVAIIRQRSRSDSHDFSDTEHASPMARRRAGSSTTIPPHKLPSVPEFHSKSQPQKPAKGAMPYQQAVRRWYELSVTQVSVALLIALNFVVEATQAQMKPSSGSPADRVFFGFEIFFVVVFTIELLWNMYGHWFKEFCTSGWNLFDFTIVLVSILSQLFPNLPGVVILRLFRAFRVFRLSKRVPSLRQIVEGVIASLSGVTNAFIVLMMLMGIWSIMGVEFFGDVDDDNFGTFAKAMLTMWQVLTLDSWCSGTARKLIFTNDMPFASVFFVSFIFAAVIVMSNVVVAVLLDKFLTASNQVDVQMNREDTVIETRPSAVELTNFVRSQSQRSFRSPVEMNPTQRLIRSIREQTASHVLQHATQQQLEELLGQIERVLATPQQHLETGVVQPTAPGSPLMLS